LNERAITSVDVCILRVDQANYDKDFIAHALNQRSFLDACLEHSGGSTRQRISRTNLGKIELCIPIEQSEQAEIANAFGLLDQAIKEVEELVLKQQRIHAGLIQDMLSRGVDSRGEIRADESSLYKLSVIGRIPAEWKVSSLGSLADFVTSGSRGWARYYSDEGAIFLRIGNLTREHINLRLADIARVALPASTEGQRTALKVDDLLISITADLGIIGVIPNSLGDAYVNQHIALVRISRSDICLKICWVVLIQSIRSRPI
jgi:type I restriction enzyme S subunit